MSDGEMVTSTPTLLIGLGGIGSRVVDQVYALLPAEHRDRVMVHAFDTNVNDIKKLEHLRGKVTQTSTDLTVGQYLYHAGATVQEWFPPASPELKRKTLTEGAGQIRLVSRLAYRSAIEQGKLADLTRQVTHLFQVRPDDTTYSPRVMIVNSLASGTGGGIFLQVAMYIRWLLETILGRQNIYVRGAFLLPDVLINTGCLQNIKEHANVRTNGYACLKELDAIVASARAAAEAAVTIELEFRPLQQDASGRLNFAITPRLLPYDFSFLFDFENTAGLNLKFLANYERQMAKAIYLQLFSPMAGPSFSEEDNNILNLIGSAGRSRYCGAGVSTLCYPYQDLIDYLALCWVTETLGAHWLRLDEDYQRELRQYESDLHNGINRERPDRGERYMSLLQNYGSADSPLPFFKAAYRTCHLVDQQGRPGEEKADRFIKAVEDFVVKTVANDGDLLQAEADCALGEGKIRIREQAAREVEQREDALEILKQKVLVKVQEHKVFIVNQALWYDCDVSGHMLGNDYQLNTWMLGRPEPLHPVAVRYLLYSIQSRLRKAVTELAAANKKTLEAIRRYDEIYDIKETEDQKETAGDRMRLALQQGRLRRLWDNQFKDFVNEYIEHSTRRLGNLTAYKVSKLRELVFAEILKQVQLMLQGWELFFQNLRETNLTLLSKKNLRIKEHEGKGDPTQIFVLASEAQKRELWEELRPQLGFETLPADLAREIYLGQYGFFCQRRHQPELQVRALNTSDFFQRHVVRWCRQQLQGLQALNLNVVRAVQREAELLNQTDDEVSAFLTAKVTGLLPLAQPFIPRLTEIREMVYWGLHPESAQALTEQQRQELFGSRGITHRAFSPYEIICYRSQYGLKAEDFPKFSAGDPEHGVEPGIYFQAYKERLRQLAQPPDPADPGETITPHLDQRWHLPAYMPDLNMRQVLADQEKIDRALLLGLIYGLFQVVTEDQRDVWVHSGPSGIRSVQVGGRDIRGQLYLLHDALFHNPAVVDLVLEEAWKRQQQDIEKEPTDLTKHRFYEGCLGKQTILQPILTYPQAAPAQASLPEKSYRLLTRLLEEIEHYYLAYYGAQEHTARNGAAELIEQLRDQAPAYVVAQEAGRADIQFRQWQTIIGDKLNELRQ